MHRQVVESGSSTRTTQSDNLRSRPGPCAPASPRCRSAGLGWVLSAPHVRPVHSPPEMKRGAAPTEVGRSSSPFKLARAYLEVGNVWGRSRSLASWMKCRIATAVAAAVVVDDVEQVLDHALVRARQAGRGRHRVSAEQAVARACRSLIVTRPLFDVHAHPSGPATLRHGDQRRRAAGDRLRHAEERRRRTGRRAHSTRHHDHGRGVEREVVRRQRRSRRAGPRACTPCSWRSRPGRQADHALNAVRSVPPAGTVKSAPVGVLEVQPVQESPPGRIVAPAGSPCRCCSSRSRACCRPTARRSSSCRTRPSSCRLATFTCCGVGVVLTQFGSFGVPSVTVYVPPPTSKHTVPSAPVTPEWLVGTGHVICQPAMPGSPMSCTPLAFSS